MSFHVGNSRLGDAGEAYLIPQRRRDRHMPCLHKFRQVSCQVLQPVLGREKSTMSRHPRNTKSAIPIIDIQAMGRFTQEVSQTR